jgi:hypothetical protein
MTFFNYMLSLWYVSSVSGNKIKVLPPIDLLYHWVTPAALAHWIMGDGKAHHSGLYLCTDNFSHQEVGVLINLLRVKFNIDARYY